MFQLTITICEESKKGMAMSLQAQALCATEREQELGLTLKDRIENLLTSAGVDVIRPDEQSFSG